MPKEFESCVKRGGRVRTKKLSGGRFMHVCFIGGKAFAGEVKKRKGNAGESRQASFRKVNRLSEGLKGE